MLCIQNIHLRDCFIKDHFVIYHRNSFYCNFLAAVIFECTNYPQFKQLENAAADFWGEEGGRIFLGNMCLGSTLTSKNNIHVRN